MRHLRWTVRILLFVLVAIFLASTVTPIEAAPPVNWDKIDPALTQAMQSKPAGTYPIIIQVGLPNDKGASSGNSRAQEALDHVRGAGAHAKNNLGILGAGTADVNWDALAKLSKNPRIRRISLDRPIFASGPMAGSTVAGLASIYTQVVRAPQVWAMGYTGKGIGIAVIDSGVYAGDDIGGRLIAQVDLVDPNGAGTDPGGHGTHVAGIAAGNGTDSLTNSIGAYKGIAPSANIISVRVINSSGVASASAVIRGIQWVVQNRIKYNIRVLNLSLGSLTQVSYLDDPVVSAVELAWRSGIVVVSAAGNHGPQAGTIDSPGIDPYSITVGALDDNMTVNPSDDVVASFSSRGPTPDNFPKPDLLAPGRRIISLYTPSSYLASLLTDRIVLTSSGNRYFRLSGTSQAAPVVSGVVALVLEKYPALKPDQIKFILTHNGRSYAGASTNVGAAGVVDAFNAVKMANGISQANKGLRPSDSFCVSVYSLIKGQPLVWKNPYYKGINWANLTWDNLTWDNLTWDNLTWDNLTWDNLTWDNLTWDNLTWDNLTWDNLTWDTSINWSSLGSLSNAWQLLAGID